MTVPRRQLLQFMAGAAALPALSRSAFSQSYPAKPVRLVVQVGAGSAPDIIARVVGQWLSDRIGQPVVIDNRPGASGNIATEAVVRSAPDGYTLLFCMSANGINASLFDNLRFSFVRDTVPVALIGRIPLVMEVHPSLPAKTVPEFIAYAKANPGKINMASSGNATPLHVAGELFKQMTGVDLVHVAYRGEPVARPDLLSGQVQMMFGVVPSSLPYIRNGQMRALAVTTEKRLDVLPDVPAMAEFLPGYEASGWYGIAAPKDTPQDDRRAAQQGNQRRPDRRQGEGTSRRARLPGLSGHARRDGVVRRGRNRQVGEGDPHRRHQAGVGHALRIDTGIDTAAILASPELRTSDNDKGISRDRGDFAGTVHGGGRHRALRRKAGRRPSRSPWWCRCRRVRRSTCWRASSRPSFRTRSARP